MPTSPSLWNHVGCVFHKMTPWSWDLWTSCLSWSSEQTHHLRRIDWWRGFSHHLYPCTNKNKWDIGLKSLTWPKHNCDISLKWLTWSRYNHGIGFKWLRSRYNQNIGFKCFRWLWHKFEMTINWSMCNVHLLHTEFYLSFIGFVFKNHEMLAVKWLENFVSICWSNFTHVPAVWKWKTKTR